MSPKLTVAIYVELAAKGVAVATPVLVDAGVPLCYRPPPQAPNTMHQPMAIICCFIRFRDVITTLAEAVGRAIARKRVEAGFTQEQVAEHLSLGREAVAQKAIPTVVRLVELAALFGCRAEDLLAGASTRKNDQATSIARSLQGLTLKDRQMPLEWIETFATRLRQ